MKLRFSTSGILRPSLRAFTLIELLAVISIIGILASILLVAISSVRRSADQTKCAANLRAVAVAGLLCINENRGKMPDAMYWRHPSQTTAGSFLPYLGYTAGQGSTSADPTLMSCPASFKELGPNADWNRGYAINIYACRTENGAWPPVSPYDRHATHLNQVPKPAAMAFLMDAHFLADGTPERKVYNSNTVVLWERLGVAGLYAGHPGGTVNVAFLDGRIEAMNPRMEFPVGDSVTQRRSPFWGSLQ